MTDIYILFTLGLILGATLPWLYRTWRDRQARQLAEQTALQIQTLARNRAEEVLSQVQKRSQDVETRIRQRYQKEVAGRQIRLKTLDEEFKEKRSTHDRDWTTADRELQRQASLAQERDRKVQERQKRFQDSREQIRTLKLDFIKKLSTTSGADSDELKAQSVEQIVREIEVEARRSAQTFEEDVRENADEIAKRVLSTVLARFPREYCRERGIGVVEIPNEEIKKKFLNNDGEILKAVESQCGVDVSIQAETNTFAVSGFDPVRRELTTRTLEKLVTERVLNVETVQRLVEKNKKDLFRRIEDDGKRVAKELGQQEFHPEIISMLGALRYRYSFAQNQHFHVAEVGWLCGLLASEIGEHIPSAKRSGLLHDIGKAMDHSIEGGHAVIGADFINKRGEQPHIVHAVRAHHFEEQPRTDLAFLVIAADAISGARPGARRSTVSSYNQKMEVLETIGDGFKGVTKTLVFNAGREVRVIVDGHRVNDEQSLVLCREIADKIETDLSYPGQIKVVVVRETHAEAIAK